MRISNYCGHAKHFAKLATVEAFGRCPHCKCEGFLKLSVKFGAVGIIGNERAVYFQNIVGLVWQ